MGISIINIIKHSSKFSAVNVISQGIGMSVSIIVATILVPAEYGIYGFLGLWLMYAGLVRPGIYSAGYREIPVLLGKGEEKEALRIQNISITPEMLYSILPFAVLLGASLFFSDPVLKIGFIITAISYAVSHFVNFWSGINYLRQNFNLVAKGNLITAFVSPIVILAGIYWLRVYALLIAPIFAAMILGIYYWKKGPINFHFSFDKKETIRLLKVGVVLQAVTLVYWGFRIADRTIIASTLSREQLGLYTFAIGFVMAGIMLFTNFGNVLTPIIWKESGKADNAFEGFKDTKRIAVYMALVASIVIPISQLGFYSIVNLITTKYIGSISIFYALSYNIYLVSIAIIPGLILGSSIVNKQRIILFFYSAGLVLNIIFDIIVIMLGYGIVGVAWVTICTQGLVTFMLYYFVKSHIFKKKKDFSKFIILISIPFSIAILFYFIHNYLNSIISNIWAFIGISLIIQAIIWSLAIGIFYKEYLSINTIKSVTKEITTIIKDKIAQRKNL
jgi:O-antigen/teichoic acid export membrane protein